MAGQQAWRQIAASLGVFASVGAVVTLAFLSPPPTHEAAATHLPSPGGSWTRPRQPGPTYMAPAWHLNGDQQLDFYTGLSFFRSPWVTAPSSTTARDGLGPLFNAHSCEACHVNGGRGKSLLDDPDSAALAVRVATRTGDGSTVPHPRYGSVLQNRSTYRPHGAGEASFAMSHAVAGREGAELRAPKLRVTPDDPEEMPDDWLVSARVPPPLLGMGLLEAIPEAAILAAADALDSDDDGISGRPHWRGATDARALGRFGWKAVHPTVAAQTGAAFRDDIGITSVAFPDESCTVEQPTCGALPTGAGEEGVEIAPLLFDYVVHFVAHMPPPKAGKLTARVRRGQALFATTGCDACHRPSFETEHGTIWPYTDLLLHDMGAGLADGFPEGDATGSEWRTPPLWGIGTAAKVTGHTTLLHDGRARDVREAILWHGGEAETARQRFMDLAPQEQRDLTAFVNAL